MRHDAFLRSLAHDSTAALEEIDIVDAQAGGFGQTNASVEQQQHECTVAVGLLGARVDRRKYRYLSGPAGSRWRITCAPSTTEASAADMGLTQAYDYKVFQR